MDAHAPGPGDTHDAQEQYQYPAPPPDQAGAEEQSSVQGQDGQAGRKRKHCEAEAVQLFVRKTTRRFRAAAAAGGQHTQQHDKIVLDHALPQHPPLSSACLAALSKPPENDWQDSVPWTHKHHGSDLSHTDARSNSTANLDHGELSDRCSGGGGGGGGTEGADSEQGQGGRSSKALLKVSAETFSGLSRMADRLGFVFSARSAKKKFQPNVNALLKALASGDAFKRHSVLGKSLTASVSVREKFQHACEQVMSEADALSDCLRPQRVVNFRTVYNSVLKHPDNSTKHHWPVETDPGPEAERPTRRFHVPSDIDNVQPADLQLRVAAKIRHAMNDQTREFAQSLCTAYGYESTQHWPNAIGWQCGNKRKSKFVDFNARDLALGLLQCTAIQDEVISAVARRRGSRQQIFKQFMPDLRGEILMMASSGVTYRSRNGYKRVFPWGSWSGSDRAVATKHEIFREIAELLQLQATHDGWRASPRAVAELEVESVLSEKGFGVKFLAEQQVGPGEQDGSAQSSDGVRGEETADSTPASTDKNTPKVSATEPVFLKFHADGRSVTAKTGEVECCLGTVIPSQPFRSTSARTLRTFAVWAGMPPICVLCPFQGNPVDILFAGGDGLKEMTANLQDLAEEMNSLTARGMDVRQGKVVGEVARTERWTAWAPEVVPESDNDSQSASGNETDDEGSKGQQDNSDAEEVDEEDAASTGGVAEMAEEEKIARRFELEEKRKTRADDLNRDFSRQQLLSFAKDAGLSKKLPHNPRKNIIIETLVIPPSPPSLPRSCLPSSFLPL